MHINEQTSTSYQTIVSKLKKLRIQWKFMMIVSGVFTWIAYLALLLAFELTLDSLLPIPRLLRIAMVIIWGGCVFWFGYFYIIKRILRDTSNERMALYIEKSYPELENRLISAIQIYPELMENDYGYSPSSIEKVIQQTHQFLSNIEAKRILKIDLLRLKKSGLAALSSAMIFLIIAIWIFPNALGYFVSVAADIPQTASEILKVNISDVKPGDYKAKSGEDVKISASVTGTMGEAVNLHYRNEGGEFRHAEMSQSENLYAFTIQNITQPLDYYIATKGVESQRYKITVMRAPVLNKFQFKLNYPKYTRLAQQVLEENSGDITALIGTEVKFEGNSNKPLASAAIVFEGDMQAEKLKISDGTSLRGAFIVQKSAKYHISLTDTEAISNSKPIQYVINAVKDEAPQVGIIAPGKDVVLDESMLIHLKIEAKDDYGVEKVKLVFRVEGREKGHTVTLKELPEPLENTLVTYEWYLEPLELFPEDVVSYHAEAFDADNVSGPNVGRSNTYIARFPSLEEIYEQVEMEQLAQQSGLEDMLDKQGEARDIVDDIIDKLRKSHELTWKEQKELERVAQMQEQIKEQAQELGKQLEETAKEIEKNQLFDLNTMQKYDELRQLMDKALSEEHKEILKKLAEALKNMNISQQEKDLLNANFKQDAFKQRLEQMIELYKKLLMQQKVEAAAKQAKELAERQEKLMEKAAELAEQAKKTTDEKAKSQQRQEAEDMAKQEDRIGNQLERLQDDLGAISDEMKEHKNLDRIAKEIARLNQESKDNQVAQNLQAASEKLRQSQPSQSLQPGNQALSGLNDLQQGLDNTAEFMRGQNAEMELAAMQKAIREGLYLSQSHERVMQTTSKLRDIAEGQYIRTERKKLHALALQELWLAEGTGILASSLWDLGKEQMLIDPKIVWMLNSANDELTRAARALEDQKPTLALPIQKQASANVNRAIAELLKAIDQMNQQMSMAGLDNMLEQLQQLAENQSQLNEMAQNLSEQLRRQGQVPGAEEMMKRMAYEQQLIREATERLAEKLEKLAEVLGSLSEVAKDMKDVEKELGGGNLNQQVLDKQRKILTRMLESTKSLQKRQLSKRRKGETAKSTFYSETPEPIDPELLKTIKKLEFQLQSGEAEDLPQQYRELVRMYYKALSEKTLK